MREGSTRDGEAPSPRRRRAWAAGFLLILAAGAATFLVAADLAGSDRKPAGSPSARASIEAVSAPEVTATPTPVTRSAPPSNPVRATRPPHAPSASPHAPVPTKAPTTAPTPSPSRAPSPGPARASISSPGAGAVVPREITVRGTVRGDLAGRTVWLFVQSPTDAGRQFLTAPIPVTDSGAAQPFTTTPTFIGDDASSGDPFAIEVVTADPKATRVIKDQPLDAGGAKSFAGLPGGAEVIARTTVKRG